MAPPALSEMSEEMILLARIKAVKRLGVGSLRAYLEHLLAKGHTVVRVCLCLCLYLSRVSVSGVCACASRALSLSLCLSVVRACLHVIGTDGVVGGASSQLPTARTLNPNPTLNRCLPFRCCSPHSRKPLCIMLLVVFNSMSKKVGSALL